MLIIHIPIRSYFNRATLYKALSFPVFVNEVRQKASQKSNFILINDLKAAATITESVCNDETRICKINKPLKIEGVEEECILTQLNVKNHSCPSVIDNDQNDYFQVLGDTIYYAVNKPKDMKLICSRNENIMKFNIQFENRGYFKLGKQCIMKNNEILILPGSYTASEQNHSTILKNIDVEPVQLKTSYKKTLVYTTKAPFSIRPIEHKSSKAVLQALNDSTSLIAIAILIGAVWAIIKYKRTRHRRTDSVSYRRGTNANEPQDCRPLTRTTTV